MNKLKDTFFGFLNIFVIAALLVFILAGLLHIGIIEPPSFLKSLFASDSENSGGNTADIPGIGSELTEYEFEYITLSSENVKKMLYSITPCDSFREEYSYTLYSSAGSVTRNICALKSSGIYCAFYLGTNGTPYRQIVRGDTITTVNTLSHGSLQTAQFSTGNMEFPAEIGSVLTHSDFFSAADDPAYTFRLISDDYGSALAITFTSQIGGYSQVQEYTLSLNYGVVTKAECYENGTLIYSLSASFLSEDLTPSFKIPSEFLKFLPPDFVRISDTEQTESEE